MRTEEIPKIKDMILETLCETCEKLYYLALTLTERRRKKATLIFM
jgi:hypothetical protein